VVIKADLGRSTLATTVLLILGGGGPGQEAFPVTRKAAFKTERFQFPSFSLLLQMNPGLKELVLYYAHPNDSANQKVPYFISEVCLISSRSFPVPHSTGSTLNASQC
jgi:hypothetical protein